MESRFILKATDKQAQALFDDTRATVKLIEFMGDINEYPEMDMTSSITHKWRVILRHNDEVGKINGTRSFAQIIKLISK